MSSGFSRIQDFCVLLMRSHFLTVWSNQATNNQIPNPISRNALRNSVHSFKFLKRVRSILPRAMPINVIKNPWMPIKMHITKGWTVTTLTWLTAIVPKEKPIASSSRLILNARRSWRLHWNCSTAGAFYWKVLSPDIFFLLKYSWPSSSSSHRPTPIKIKGPTTCIKLLITNEVA